MIVKTTSVTTLRTVVSGALNRVGCFLLLLVCFHAPSTGATPLPDFTDMVRENSAAVVNISTVAKQDEAPASAGPQIPELPDDSPFHDFFRKFFEEQAPGNPDAPPRQSASLGSGFIISTDGYVITNNHVVADAREVIVRLNDRREFVAEIVGTDRRSDIAVLKIDGNDLPVVKLGSSVDLEVGEWVLAIGSPFGFDYSVTQGIISAIGRSLPNENYVPFIQTDVAINPGNSGGPLFNLDGEVVGVNAQIYSRTGGFMGLSFAVPIDVVLNVYTQLRESGRVSRGWLGVLIQDVTRELAESFAMDKPHGALVAQVLPDSPAAAAGIEVGDVIVEYDGTGIAFSADLPPLVGNSKINTRVPLKVMRAGARKTLKVLIAELPEENQLASARNPDSRAAPVNAMKVLVRNLTDAQRAKLDLPAGGVMVANVMPGPGRAAGIRRGDVILMMNNEEVADVSQFEQLLAELPRNRSLPILIQRGGAPTFLALKLPENDE